MENSAQLGGSTVQSPSRLTIEEIKALRVDLDAVLRKLQATGYSPMKEYAMMKVKESRHWLGEMLKELGSELPKEFQDKAE